MPKQQPSKTTASTKKKTLSTQSQLKRLNSYVGDSKKKALSPRVITKKSELMEFATTRDKKEIATQYEVNLTLSVTKRSQPIATISRKSMTGQKDLSRTETMELVVDKARKIIVKSGTVQIVMKNLDTRRGEESVNGMDAIDAELILQLFGVIE